MNDDRKEYKKGEVMDSMRKMMSKPEKNGPASGLRLMLSIAVLIGLFLSADWYLPHAASANPLLHNSDQLGVCSNALYKNRADCEANAGTWTPRWPADGGWGIPTGKYGEFVCETCHVRFATNIKSVRSSITTPNTTKGTLPGHNQPIIFDRTVGTIGGSGTMGDDSGNSPRTSSDKICEVCHTYDASQTAGVNVHPYNSQGATLGNHFGSDAMDCTDCHKHNIGFNPIDCNDCHGNPPLDLATLANYGGKTTGSATAGAHSKHNTLGYVCGNCHNGYIMPEPSTVSTPDLTNQWNISIGFSNFPLVPGGPSTSGTYTGLLNVSYNQAAGTGGLTCSTVYCHGGTIGAPADPVWNSAVACGDCHNAFAATPPTLGNHARHAGSDGGAGQLNLACTDCHGANGAGATGHMDGNIQWGLNTALDKFGAGAKYNGAASGTLNNLAPSASYQTCSTVYCHSNVQGAGGSGVPTSYKTPAWGGGALGCAGCHADNSSASGTGGHTKHANVYSFACSVCHDGAGAGTGAHADYSINVTFSGQAAWQATPAYSQAGTPGNGYGSCSTNYCHSNVQAPGGTAPATVYGTPTWGDTGALSCGSCHTDMSTTTDLTLGTHQRHTNATGIATYACDMCHGAGYSATTVNAVPHANGLIDTTFTAKAAGTTYSQAGSNTPGVDGYGTCSTNSCHGRAFKNWGVSSNLTVCEKCHGSAESIAVDGGFRDTAGSIGSAFAGTHASHLTGLHNYTDPMHCETCHIEPTTFGDVITGVGHTGTLPATLTWGNLATGNIRNPGTPSHAPDYSGAPTRTCSSTYCHSQGGTKPSPTWGDLGYGLSCGNCHGNPPAFPHPQGDNCKGCHYHVAASNTGFEASYRLIEGICSIRTYSTQTTCESNGGVWTPPDTLVPGKSLHLDGIMQVTADECLNCHTNLGQFALLGQHDLHTDNDYFLSISETNGTATGGTTTTVVDTTKAWTPSPAAGDLVGKYVRFTNGSNNYEQRKIISNTATSLTMESAVASAVTNGTGYNIRRPKTLSNDDYDDPGWIYSIYYKNGFPRYGCGFCHPENSATHRNGIANLDLDPTHSLPGTVKTKNDPTGPWFDVIETGVNVTCNNLYCHSTGYIDPLDSKYDYAAAPNWYAASPWAGMDRCTQCHGNSPNSGGKVGSHAHEIHVVGVHHNDTFSGSIGKMSTSHGDGNSTTINCNICHNTTVKVAYNDKSAACSTCHNGTTAALQGSMMVDVANTSHVDGIVDVAFVSPLNLKTKAQLRDPITDVPTLDSSWTRNNGYKQLAISHDLTKTTPTYSAGTCSTTACHNATPMQWNQAGPLQCVVCHIGLPE